MKSETLHTLLQGHVPPAALPYCFGIWEEHPFRLVLKKRRITKVGDYSWRPGKGSSITINHDLHPYLFLLTYIHEVAHLRVHQQFGRRTDPHGSQWKQIFRDLMEPLLRTDIFPAPLRQELQRHMRDPMASSFSDSQLTRALRDYDEKQRDVVLLSQLPEGTVFGLNGKWFRKGEQKRTRVLCHELHTRRRYLVPADAPVEMAQLGLTF